MPHSVTVYTTPLCEPCEQVKAYLRGRGVPFALVDVLMDEAAADRLNERGVFTAPAIEIDGQLIEGFDQARLDALLSSP